VTGVCEHCYITGNFSYTYLNTTYNSKWWFPTAEWHDGEYYACWKKLDIATMTIEKTVFVEPYAGQDGLGVGDCEAPNEVGWAHQFHPGLNCLFGQLTSFTDAGCDLKTVHKIELESSNSAFIRFTGKAGWGGHGKNSTVRLDWASVGTRTEPPTPDDVGDEDDGHEERPFDPFKIVGPGSIGRLHKFGKGVKP
jgi:hypothetical protein